MNLRENSPSIEALLFKAQQQGILPVTSQCNMSCTFCSNHYNPPSCEIFTIPPRSLDDIKDTLTWLDAVRSPIVIGESVTRINEGEPFTHPKIMDILELLRKAYPDRGIRVTTNCSLLDRSIIERLADLRVELVVSLNTVGCRKEVMGDMVPDKTLENVRYLKGKVMFDGSIVALPFLTGWDDIEETVKFLEESGVQTVRLLCPGFSRLHPLAKHVSPDLPAEIRAFAARLRKKVRVPILVEPPGLEDVSPRVEDVLRGSPAWKAGIRPMDIIREVDGLPVFSRLEAFQMVHDRENPKVHAEREGGMWEFTIRKNRFSHSGLVMYEDLDYSSFSQWERKSGIRRGKKVVILTSQLGVPIIRDALVKRGLSCPVIAVKSAYFGGNIQAGGLLTVSDFELAYKEASSRSIIETPDLITIPSRAFDPWGRDLEGVSYHVLEEKLGVPVMLAG